MFSKKSRKSKASSTADTLPAGAGSRKLSSSSEASQTEYDYGVKTLHDGGNSTIDILFVHGLRGHRERTWQAKNASNPWPRALLPSKISNARILAYGYDARVTSLSGMVSTNTIGKHSRNMLSAIATHRDGDKTSDRPMIFVCHSLGGLVCQDALSWAHQTTERHLRQVLDCTRGIVFFGTPHRGSGLARWAQGLASFVGLIQETNRKILDVLERDSEVLARVQEGFHEMINGRREHGLERINITCFYEELGLPGIGLVVPSESTVIPGSISLGIGANHMDMTKFQHSDDPGFRAVAGELSRWCSSMANASSSDSTTSASRKGCNTIPFEKDPKFVGREDVIEQIDKQFESNNRIALYGLGGVGKSQIAIEYAYRFQQKYPDAHVFWVYSNSASSIHHGYLRIAEKLGLSERDKQLGPLQQNSQHVNIIRLVCQTLQSSDSGRWLLILDNLDDVEALQMPQESQSPVDDGPSMQLIEYMPSSTEGLTLITTRDKSTARLLANSFMIEIEFMDPSEARSLLQSRLAQEGTVDQNQAAELVEALDHLPLAITQAAAFILNNEVPLEEYLRLLRKGEDEISVLMTEEQKDLRRNRESESSVVQTLKISFNKIRETSPRAVEILCLMAVLERQGIPEVLLKRPGESEAEFKNSLGKLKVFSLISTTKCQDILAMHRLVQLAARKWIKFNKETDKYEAEALKALERTFLVGKFENESHYEVLLPHVEVVIQYKFPGELDMPCANLLHNLALYNLSQGCLKLAFARFSQALSLRERVTKLEENAEALRSLYYTAELLWLQGDYNEAQKRHQKVLDCRTTLLGSNHRNTIESMEALGKTFLSLENYTASKDLYQQTLEAQKRIFGPKHRATISTICNLATVFYKLKMHSEALEMKIQALELCKKVHGPEDIITVSGMNDLVYLLYLVQTDHAPINITEQLFKQGIKSVTTGFPIEPEIMNALVANLSQGTQQNQASDIVQQIFDVCNGIYGHDHLSVLLCMANLESFLSKLRKYDEAENIRRRALELCSKALGPIYGKMLSVLGPKFRFFQKEKHYIPTDMAQ